MCIQISSPAHHPHPLLSFQVKCVYSWYFVSDKGLLSFDQMPWFSVVERLEKEKEIMMEEREAFKQQLIEQQVGRRCSQRGVTKGHSALVVAQCGGRVWGGQ